MEPLALHIFEGVVPVEECDPNNQLPQQRRAQTIGNTILFPVPTQNVPGGRQLPFQQVLCIKDLLVWQVLQAMEDNHIKPIPS
jgi:hypothetical protein